MGRDLSFQYSNKDDLEKSEQSLEEGLPDFTLDNYNKYLPSEVCLTKATLVQKILCCI